MVEERGAGDIGKDDWPDGKQHRVANRHDTLAAHKQKLDNLFDQNSRIEAQISREMENLRDAIKAQEYRRSTCDDTSLRAVKRWFKSQQEIEIQRRYSRAFYYEGLGDQRDSIKSAHSKTFQWVLKNPETN